MDKKTLSARDIQEVRNALATDEKRDQLNPAALPDLLARMPA